MNGDVERATLVYNLQTELGKKIENPVQRMASSSFSPSIADYLYHTYTYSLTGKYELGGHVVVHGDCFRFEESAFHTGQQGVIVWRGAHDVLWHTHPQRGYAWEPPSGRDLSVAMRMSMDKDRAPVQGYVLEQNGVWYYRVVFDEMRDEDELDAMTQDLGWVGDMLGARMSHVPEAVEMYEEDEDKVPINTPEEYRTALRKHFSERYVDVLFYPTIVA